MNEQQPQKYNDPCVDAGLLVSLRDEELTTGEMEQIKAHLAVCPDCAANEPGNCETNSQICETNPAFGHPVITTRRLGIPEA